ncbi:ARMT1-like domain-containing protein [Salininema proteolyticum]|uniref:ARMT1-like domain-containing protein n=1 Tax=Salininema proteolyticum TaxID=1607685 RepID=A0ABV8TUK6_9ACTN
MSFQDGPAPIGIADPADYGWGVFHNRHPRLIERLTADFPYSARIRAALAALQTETVEGTVSPLPTVGDHAWGWAQGLDEKVGLPWSRLSFLWAEALFYRRLLIAVEYFDADSPWHGVDPFAPVKNAELAPDAIAPFLDRAATALTLPDDERRHAVLETSLWGNLADLAVRIDTPGIGATDRDHRLLSDDGPRIWTLLENTAPGTVVIIADNAGREITADLLLADELLRSGLAADVAVDVKPQPFFVSDATAADLSAALAHLRGHRDEAVSAAGDRLAAAAGEGRFTVETHWFYTAPRTYRDLPDSLRKRYERAVLVIAKGDLNYRRLTSDLHWNFSTPFEDIASYFPTNLAALRVMKSELAAGIDAALAEELEKSGRGWRTEGVSAVIQTALLADGDLPPR